MTEVWFYHLERTPVESVLPRIVAGLMQRGNALCVQVATRSGLEAISKALWSFEDTSFIAHGHSDDPVRQPVWLTTDGGTPNGATIRLYAAGSMPDEIGGLTRAMVFIPADDEGIVQMAREAWKRFRSQGLTVRYWRQNEAGRWEDQAAQKAA